MWRRGGGRTSVFFSKKESFLALDIGMDFVRGLGMVKSGASKSHEFYTESGEADIKQNIINAADAIENKLGVKFKGAFVTGDFGIAEYRIFRNSVRFAKRRRITDADIYGAIFDSPAARALAIAGVLMHLIPLQFIIDGNDVSDMTDCFCDGVEVKFGAVIYQENVLDEIKAGLMSACFPSLGFYDPMYILGKTYHKKGETSVFVDFGKSKTAVAVWTDRGMVQRFDLPDGQTEVIRRLESDFGINRKDAEEIKLAVLSAKPAPSDEYVLASKKYNSLTQGDVWDAWIEVNERLIARILDKIKYENFSIFITGAEVHTAHVIPLILKNKGLDENALILGEYAAVLALGKTILRNRPRHNDKIKFQPRRRIKVPIIPSIMCWNFKGGHVYKMFEAVGIRKVHFDIMDGFHTTKVFGAVNDISGIRAKTRMHIHAHLMVENPLPWAEGAAAAGADTIIVSTGTRNIVAALKKIKTAGKLCGLAVAPDFDLKELQPELLRMLDEVMVMAVPPGAAGQKFIQDTIKRIRTFANTRDKYGFNYKISVDGGINDKTATACWEAGADELVSGSFLHDAPDFPDAVLKLLPKR